MSSRPILFPAREREAMTEARDWLLDAFGEEAHGEIRSLNAIGIMSAVEAHYEGGWDQFLLDTDNVRQSA